MKGKKVKGEKKGKEGRKKERGEKRGEKGRGEKGERKVPQQSSNPRPSTLQLAIYELKPHNIPYVIRDAYSMHNLACEDQKK